MNENLQDTDVRRFRFHFGFRRWLALAVLCGLAFLRLIDPYPVTYSRLATFDLYQRYEPRNIPSQENTPITIVGIDETSLEKYGQWPWPRSILADLTKKLHEAGANIIAFDVLFAEVDRAGDDSGFANAIWDARVVLGSGAYWNEVETSIHPPPKTGIAFFKQGKINITKHLQEAPHIVTNISSLRTAAAGEGVFSFNFDRDGRLRRIPTIFNHKKQLHPNLGLEILRVIDQRKVIFVTANKAGIEKVAVSPDRGIPTDRYGRAWIYFSEGNSVNKISVFDVLNGDIDPNLIKGKIILIGAESGVYWSVSLLCLLMPFAATCQSLALSSLLTYNEHFIQINHNCIESIN